MCCNEGRGTAHRGECGNGDGRHGHGQHRHGQTGGGCGCQGRGDHEGRGRGAGCTGSPAEQAAWLREKIARFQQRLSHLEGARD